MISPYIAPPKRTMLTINRKLLYEIFWVNKIKLQICYQFPLLILFTYQLNITGKFQRLLPWILKVLSYKNMQPSGADPENIEPGGVTV